MHMYMYIYVQVGLECPGGNTGHIHANNIDNMCMLSMHSCKASHVH